MPAEVAHRVATELRSELGAAVSLEVKAGLREVMRKLLVLFREAPNICTHAPPM